MEETSGASEAGARPQRSGIPTLVWKLHSRSPSESWCTASSWMNPGTRSKNPFSPQHRQYRKKVLKTRLPSAIGPTPSLAAFPAPGCTREYPTRLPGNHLPESRSPCRIHRPVANLRHNERPPMVEQSHLEIQLHRQFVRLAGPGRSTDFLAVRHEPDRASGPIAATPVRVSNARSPVLP